MNSRATLPQNDASPSTKFGVAASAGKNATAPVARLSSVTLFHGKTRALDGVKLELPAGRMLGLIGPDGVGKSSLLSLIAGAHVIQQGEVEVLGGSMREKRHRDDICP